MKRLISLFLVVTMMCAFSITTFAAESPEKGGIDDIYQAAYNQCKGKVRQSITDDYAAYSFLLSKESEVKVSDNGITVPSGLYENLSSAETKCVANFITRINALCNLGAITVDDSLMIHKKEAPTVQSRPQPRAEVIDLMPEARRHASELKSVYDNAVFGTAHIVAGAYFAERVKGGGIWDYKVYLGVNNQYYESELRATMTGETIGNFHYGDVGSVCFGPTTLKSAAGFVQILSGTSDLSYWDSYWDDPRDQNDIQWGINVYNAEH